MIVMYLYVVAHRDIGYDVIDDLDMVCDDCARVMELRNMPGKKWYVSTQEEEGGCFQHHRVEHRCIVCEKGQPDVRLIEVICLEVNPNA